MIIAKCIDEFFNMPLSSKFGYPSQVKLRHSPKITDWLDQLLRDVVGRQIDQINLSYPKSRKSESNAGIVLYETFVGRRHEHSCQCSHLLI